MNKRYRMVTTQNGQEHVHSGLLAEDEIQEHLDAEALLHKMGGWTVTEGDRVLVCRKKDIERIITIRESDAHNDSLEFVYQEA